MIFSTKREPPATIFSRTPLSFWILAKMRKLCLIFGQVQARRQSIQYAKNRPAVVKYIEDKNELFCRELAFRTIILINKRYTHFSYHIK